MERLTHQGYADHLVRKRHCRANLDFNLPKTDSRSVLRTIKEDQKLRLIPVAVLTASESDRDIRDAYSLYANCYLRKPVDLDSFLGTIRDTAHFWLNVAYLPG